MTALQQLVFIDRIILRDNEGQVELGGSEYGNN